MTNLSLAELEESFRNNDFPRIEGDNRGIRFLKLRSMSRKMIIVEYCELYLIDLQNLPFKEYFAHLFENPKITDSTINHFMNQKYEQERQARFSNQEYLVDQLNRLQSFDWGGSYKNSLEKNIINNVKKIQSYDRINEAIEDKLLTSLRCYTLNSWYNHWTSILIEDIFKDHKTVLPTVGLVKKIDFFINDIPFDLKVTYFPEQLLVDKLQENGYGNELTRLKQICRTHNIFIPDDLNNKALKLHLYTKISEDQRQNAKEFISTLKEEKIKIIAEAKENPTELKKWLYENQGEARFDASNRFFLVLINETELSNSWKIKRNIVFLREQIHAHLDDLSMDMASLKTTFYWKVDKKTYHCKSDILFLTY